MSSAARAKRRKKSKAFFLQKPRGQVTSRVHAVGPEHFGIVSIDCAKKRSKYMLADFYGNVLIPPTELIHNQGDIRAAVDRLRQAFAQHDVRDFIIAIERTGEYHRPLQRAFRQLGWEVRLVHPFATKQFRLPADPGNKTDDTDLAAIHRAAVNGFGLLEAILPPEYAHLQLLIRHRRDLVHKTSAVCCQIRECLHAAMPGFIDCFGANPWLSPIAFPVARQLPSAAAILQAGLSGLTELARQTGRRCRQATLSKILAWAQNAPAAHPHGDCLQQMLISLDDDRLAKTKEIQTFEQMIAQRLVRLPYVLLLTIPGINLVSAADLAGEMGPPCHYANANAITGRAGLMPARYQSDEVDCADGPLRRCGHRRLRAALMQIADNLVTCNNHFKARAGLWTCAGKDARWIRVKVAKSFSRIAFAMVAGRCLFPHACCQQRHYILSKILAFHQDHETPTPQVLADLQAAADQLPPSARDSEAQPLAERLQKLQAQRRGPQPLADIIPIVLARLGVRAVQSEMSGDRNPS